MLAALAHVETWIFDLDNTLYPAEIDLFAQIDARITAYVQRRLGLDPVAARRLQKQWFHEHGTTLAGLMAAHGVDPHEYLADVHAIELGALAPDPALGAALGRLPGRKLVFTNGDAPHAERILARLGLSDRFAGVHDIHAAGLLPKPDPRSYQTLCARWGVDPARALFVEDMARNLKPAKAIGMTTVWLDNGSEQDPGDAARDFIDYRVTALAPWLNHILEDA